MVMYYRSADAYVGEHVADAIDVFEEWCDKNGSDDMQLMLVALLDHTTESPGMYSCHSFAPLYGIVHGPCCCVRQAVSPG